MVQKEVAERAVARDGKESILSIAVKAFGVPRIAAKVPAGAFRPAPKVDSAVLVVDNVSRRHFEHGGGLPKERIKHFFTVVHAGFAHKRKLLARNLEAAASKEKIKNAFDLFEISEKARAEDILAETWIALAEALR